VPTRDLDKELAVMGMSGTLASVAQHAARVAKDPHRYAAAGISLPVRLDEAWFGKVFIETENFLGNKLTSARLVVEVSATGSCSCPCTGHAAMQTHSQGDSHATIMLSSCQRDQCHANQFWCMHACDR
jgi:hypothetical protein